MELHYISGQEGTKAQHRSRRLTQAQVRVLESSFSSNHKLQAERKAELAARLGVSPRQVAVWYQNRRARHKTQSIELDCRAIQLRLDAALDHNRRLQKEVAMLEHELFKAREMLLLASPSAANSYDHDHAPTASSDYVDELPVEHIFTCLSPWP